MLGPPFVGGIFEDTGSVSPQTQSRGWGRSMFSGWGDELLHAITDKIVSTGKVLGAATLGKESVVHAVDRLVQESTERHEAIARLEAEVRVWKDSG